MTETAVVTFNIRVPFSELVGNLIMMKLLKEKRMELNFYFEESV